MIVETDRYADWTMPFWGTPPRSRAPATGIQFVNYFTAIVKEMRFMNFLDTFPGDPVPAYVLSCGTAWRDVWVGAAVTSLLFWIGKYLIGLYLARSAVASPFGAAGTLVVVIVWVYYSAQIFFLGAEFTRAYAASRHPVPQERT